MVMQDKYDLALKFKAKHKNRLDKANNSNTFKDWDNQTEGKFAHIPISDQKIAIHRKPTQHETDMLTIHEKVKATHTFNFLDAQIHIPLQLNADIWEENFNKLLG